MVTVPGLGFSYKGLGQLTQETSVLTTTIWPGGTFTTKNMQYVYASGSNNGRVTMTQDLVAGETVAYQYDSLRENGSA